LLRLDCGVAFLNSFIKAMDASQETFSAGSLASGQIMDAPQSSPSCLSGRKPNRMKPETPKQGHSHHRAGQMAF
jgi:hypothetical protein